MKWKEIEGDSTQGDKRGRIRRDTESRRDGDTKTRRRLDTETYRVRATYEETHRHIIGEIETGRETQRHRRRHFLVL